MKEKEWNPITRPCCPSGACSCMMVRDMVMATPPQAPQTNTMPRKAEKSGAKATAPSTMAPTNWARIKARPWRATSPRRSSREMASTRPMELQTFMRPRSVAEPWNTSRTSSGSVTM